MKKGFEIGQSNEIIKTGKIYDLHNIYEFIGVFLNAKKRRLRLLFEPRTEYRKHQLSITLSFEEIDYLEFSANFGSRVISGLDEIGYKTPEDRDDKWLINEQQATPNDHLFFRMDGGEFIRIHCQNADLFETAKLTSIY